MLFRFLDSFIEYVKDGLKHMRVKFYIQGSEPGKQGTVHLEVKEVWGLGGDWVGTEGSGAAGRKPWGQKLHLEICLFSRTQKVASMNFDIYLLNLSPTLEELLSLKIIDPEVIAEPRQARLLGRCGVVWTPSPALPCSSLLLPSL